MASSTNPKANPVSLRLDLTRAGPAGATVLGPVSLTLMQGETLALTGPSGIGKTTLLRVIAGLEPSFDGLREVPGRIAMVFQEPVLLPWRTAVQNLTIAAGLTMSEAEDWLSSVGLAGLGKRFPGQLSLGQQRRLSLARAFSVTPDLMLMDEPFVSLDPAMADEMMGLFETLRAAKPVSTILVTHAQAEAARLATRTLRLEGIPAQLAA